MFIAGFLNGILLVVLSVLIGMFLARKNFLNIVNKIERVANKKEGTVFERPSKTEEIIESDEDIKIE